MNHLNKLDAWLGRCQLSRDSDDGQAIYDTTAAVFCHNPVEYENTLRAEVRRQGYELRSVADVISLTAWNAANKEIHPQAPLAHAVHQWKLVEIGDMSNVTKQTSEEGSQSYLSIEEIEGIEPLDSQADAHPRKTVPDKLMEHLFGQSDPTETEIKYYGGADKVPPMKTYAIVDAAKMSYGHMVITDCDMQYRCLFKGESAEELKDVAPYLIELELGKKFTRTLFTHNPKMPDDMSTVHLWHKEPSIYIRSRTSFDGLWGHFRKFTRVQNEVGKWYYFAFWAPRTACNTFQSMERDSSDVASFFHPRDDVPIHALYAITQNETRKISPNHHDSSVRKPFILTDKKRKFIDKGRGDRFKAEYAQELYDLTPKHREWLGIDAVKPVEMMIVHISDMIKEFGFIRRNEIAKLTSLAFFYGTQFLNDPRIYPLAQTHLYASKKRSLIQIKNFEDSMEQRGVSGVIMADYSLEIIQEILVNPVHISRDVLNKIINENSNIMPVYAQDNFGMKCRIQQQKWKLTSEIQILAHELCALVFTPFFLDDPLHEKLRKIFLESFTDVLIENLHVEFKRRLNITGGYYGRKK